MFFNTSSFPPKSVKLTFEIDTDTSNFFLFFRLLLEEGSAGFFLLETFAVIAVVISDSSIEISSIDSGLPVVAGVTGLVIGVFFRGVFLKDGDMEEDTLEELGIGEVTELFSTVLELFKKDVRFLEGVFTLDEVESNFCSNFSLYSLILFLVFSKSVRVSE